MKKTISGFTIVELLIVIVVIAILAAISVVAYTGIQARANDSSRDSAASAIRKTLEMYKADNGTYPNACGSADLGCAVSSLASYLTPTYISSLPNYPDAIAYPMQYVTNSGLTGYGLLVEYKSKPRCKFLINTSTTGWWGVSVPQC